MECEIKFRGKRVNDSKWVYGDLLHIAGGCIIYHGSQKNYETTCSENIAIALLNDEISVIYPATVGQFTGIFDKNGREVYEGDILQNTSREVQYRVYWSIDTYAWFVERINYGSKEPTCCLGDNFEVVGSIHDNPN